MSLARRVKRIEQRVGIEDKEPIVVIVQIEHGDDAPRFDEREHEWLTFMRTQDGARQRGLGAAAFVVDPYAEYEARHGLEPGTLSDHPLKGEVPFAELLEKATATVHVRDRRYEH